MKKEKYDEASEILKKIEEISKQVNYLELYDHCGLMFYAASEIEETKENRFGVYFDKNSLKMVAEYKKEQIKKLEKEFEAL